MHVIVGAGTIGSTTARLLAEAGAPVRIITRTGSGPEHPLIERVTADASNAAELVRLAAGATVLYNCANPPYHSWPTDWPPLSDAMIKAAESSGAVLAITGNLYVYGPVDRPMTEDMPMMAQTVKGRVRMRMWQDALDAHRAGRIRAFEVRASDYIGPKYTLIEQALPALRAGKVAWMPAPLDVPHTFTYTGDVARALVQLAGEEQAWGHAWHVPSAEPMTVREFLRRTARVGGLPEPKLRSFPKTMIYGAALFDKFAKEFLEMRYQFERPFVLDSSRTERTFDLYATPVDDAVRASL